MKKFKIFIMAACTLIAVTGIFAFQASHVNTTNNEYIYKSTSDDLGELRDPGNWQIVDGMHPTPEGCPDTEEIPCYVSYGEGFETFLETANLNDVLGISVRTKSVE